jgi:hypothetical protein
MHCASSLSSGAWRRAPAFTLSSKPRMPNPSNLFTSLPLYARRPFEVVVFIITRIRARLLHDISHSTFRRLAPRTTTWIFSTTFSSCKLSGMPQTAVSMLLDSRVVEVNRFVIRYDSWSQLCLEQSEAARAHAAAQLGNPSQPDGSFVLRDSTSRENCFGTLALTSPTVDLSSYCRRSSLVSLHRTPFAVAISIKFQGAITHVLVETNRNNTVQIKDATRGYPNLDALIQHHYKQADGSSRLSM